jgi:hypothetical protein
MGFSATKIYASLVCLSSTALEIEPETRFFWRPKKWQILCSVAERDFGQGKRCDFPLRHASSMLENLQRQE